MRELQDKLDRLQNLYIDGALPLESRHTLELVTDLADVVNDIDERLKNIEGRVDYIANKTA